MGTVGNSRRSRQQHRVGPLWVVTVSTLIALCVIGAQQLLHQHMEERSEPGPVLHWLRDGALAVPLVLVAVALTALPVVRRTAARVWAPGQRRAGWSLTVAVIVGAGMIPGSVVHSRLFVDATAHEHEAMGTFEHLLRDAAPGALVALLAALAVALTGSPWSPEARLRLPAGWGTTAARGARRAAVAVTGGALVVAGTSLPSAAVSETAAVITADTIEAGCRAGQANASHTLTADVVALDQSFDYNRLGATNPAGMIFALRHDVVLERDLGGVPAGTPLSDPAAAALSGSQLAGKVTLRSDKRPRPLTLRIAVGDCLRINFQNLLSVTPTDAQQPADRHVGIHVKGMAVVDSIADDGTYVGKNPSGLTAPGQSKTYLLYGDHENGYVLDNGAARGAGEAIGGTTPFGLFGAVNVEPWGTDAYRSQLTRAEMDLASSAWDGEGPVAEPQYIDDGNGTPVPNVKLTPDGQPIINYDAVYPTDPAAPGYDAARAGMPIVRMVDPSGRIVHSDLNAVIAGPGGDNKWKIPANDYPADYWQNQIVQENQRRGEEPFREFTVIFHDEIFAIQAFPEMFNNKETFQHTLHGVKDGFGINYGVAGVGAEVIANRLEVGPMADCVECKFEEFFLTAWAVGDPAMIVDTPANKVLDGAPQATFAKYPDDPSNVHHSYLNDRVKYRNLHVGPMEHHIFHLHAHQWQGTPNEANSTYLDSQLIGPGAGYTYDIAYGGSGNRNKTVGDSIFHCHFYPHFAQGMWELWRVHDTFERGTLMDGQKPAAGSRALPDGEIVAGTPIPAVVPMPSKPMAPTPSPGTTVVEVDLDGSGPAQASSQVDVNGDGTADVEQDWLSGLSTAEVDELDNPGYPFFIAGVAGHRPPTPPLDMTVGSSVVDGGLSRHIIVGGEAQSFVTPRDMNKILERTEISYVPEDGTVVEKVAMGFHAQTWHPTYTAEGAKVDGDDPEATRHWTGGVKREIKGFETNGLPAVPGAPFADPCRTDGTWGADLEKGTVSQAGRTTDYKAAVIQLDAVFNKTGWHFPQQRIEALWDDVSPTLTGDRAPEPLVMRLAAGDCATVQHANLVPNVYELDDYQVRTPTDVIGQHIHLVKFDVTSADGSANGWNYEDGTLSPQEVEERIHAVRAGTAAGGQPLLGVSTKTCTNGGGDSRQKVTENPGTPECPLARLHPFFGGKAGVGDMAWGARTTVQRWYADPVLNKAWDSGHGSVFTHDHFGPSTHQQTGLYATVLVEPPGATWWDPETGQQMGKRHDGGPTSWRADIRTEDVANSHREFYLEFADFAHAYTRGGGALHTDDNLDGEGTQIPSYADPTNVINPSVKVPAASTPDLFDITATCPNGTPRPCPEAISADDVGTVVVNYRNEPIAQRVYDPDTKAQAEGPAGDLSLAFQSRTDRRIPELNSQPSTYPVPAGVEPGDPYTPLLRAYAGDTVRVRMQVGATEEQHNVTIQGVKWKEEPLSSASGWRSGKASGISEYFVVQSPLMPDAGTGNPSQIDHLYTTGAAADDLWNGAWGILRSYQKPRSDLRALPNNQVPKKGWTISNSSEMNNGAGKGTCLVNAPVRSYDVSAVRAADVLGDSGLVYNSRGATITAAGGVPQADGALQDPTALMYVLDSDLVVEKKTGKPLGLKEGTPVEPLVLRAAAGDCIKVQLTNRLPSTLPDLPGYNALPPILTKATAADGSMTTFNANDVAASSTVGLHASLVHYSARNSNGLDVGSESGQGILPGKKGTYVWYAGDVVAETSGSSSKKLVAHPVEYGAIGLSSSDLIKGASKGLVGALVVEPPGSSWSTDSGTRTSATVTTSAGSFRELVAVVQDDVNLRYSGSCPGVPADMQCAVPAVPSEGKGVPEDSEDSGSKAINYRSDPVWYRLGVAPDTPFEDPLLRGNSNTHRALSNTQVGGSDPSVPILTAAAGDKVRIRIVQPGGHNRGHVFSVNGHSWQRLPSTPSPLAGSDLSDRLSWSFGSDPTKQDSAWPGHWPTSSWVGAQDGMGPAINSDFIIPEAGGAFRRPGDYLISDAASVGGYQGLWALLRVSS